MCPSGAAHLLVWFFSSYRAEPQRWQRGIETQTRVLCQSQHRERCVIVTRRGSKRTVFLQPKM